MAREGDERTAERERMVEAMRRRGMVSDARVLEAFRRVPRHEFVPPEQAAFAYEDRALPLVEGQTISQPTMVGIMLQALDCQPGDVALEIGAGSGYAAALLAELISTVHAVEIREALAIKATRTLERLGVDNVHVHVGDGSRGLPTIGPFSRILVSAGTSAPPEALLEALAPGGRIALPVGGPVTQMLTVGERRTDGTLHFRASVPCVFVPLVEA